MLSDRSLSLIKNVNVELSKPVRLVLFTSDTGCETCPDLMQLARAIKTRFNRIALETYDIVMDRDKAEQYGIKIAPALVVQGGEGQTVMFYGLIEDVFLDLLLSTIMAVSHAKAWFPENVRRALGHLANDVSIRVFVDSDCPQCRPVAETAIGLALESKLISTSIIVASDFPDLVKRYQVSVLPKTIFGENLHMDGHVTESTFLEMIFQAEGVKPGPERKCLICGTTSPDIICTNCRAKIQAEAVNHKLKSDRMKTSGTL
jgi:thiol-disulfide isomerase/thioredoxin